MKIFGRKKRGRGGIFIPHSPDSCNGPVTTIKITPEGEIEIKREFFNSSNLYPLHEKRWTKETYEQYLESKHWKRLRAEKINLAKQRNKYRCSICGAKENLQVHHLRYKNIYDVDTSDLRIFCKRCHSLTHKLIKDGKLKFRSKKTKKMFKITRGNVLREIKAIAVNKNLDDEFNAITQ